MSKERELIKDMKILLECTSMGGLQRNADVLIGRAIELLAKPEPDQEPVAWRDLITDIDYLITAFEDGADACDYWGDIINLRHDLKKVTLVVVQPEPLSGMKILEGLDIEKVPSYKALTFQRGVRWAEQQHGIGVADE